MRNNTTQHDTLAFRFLRAFLWAIALLLLVSCPVDDSSSSSNSDDDDPDSDPEYTANIVITNNFGFEAGELTVLFSSVANPNSGITIESFALVSSSFASANIYTVNNDRDKKVQATSIPNGGTYTVTVTWSGSNTLDFIVSLLVPLGNANNTHNNPGDPFSVSAGNTLNIEGIIDNNDAIVQIVT